MPRQVRLAAIRSKRRPHIRLGLAWTLLTAGAVAGGPLALAAWLGLGGGLAAWQGARGWHRRSWRAVPVLAGTGALALAGAALAGPVALVATVGAIAVVAVGARRAALRFGQAGSGRPRSRISPLLTLGLACAGGAPAAGAVLSARGGWPVVVALLGLAVAYDAGSYLVGTGATGAWEGSVAGVASMLPVVLVVAAVASPRGFGPWLLGLTAAALAPAGARLGRILRGQARAPALGRLDSLILLAPVWAALAPWLLG